MGRAAGEEGSRSARAGKREDGRRGGGEEEGNTAIMPFLRLKDKYTCRQTQFSLEHEDSTVGV